MERYGQERPIQGSRTRDGGGVFPRQDAKLLEKLRAQAKLGDLATALKEKLQVDDTELLEEIGNLGVTSETGAALLLAPLVQVAWVDGVVTDREREAVLELAASRGVPPGSPAHAKLVEWLDQRPPDRLFDVALTTIKVGLSVLPPAERREREQRVENACRHVAVASGGLAGLFGMGGEINKLEAKLLETITERLRAKGKKA